MVLLEGNIRWQVIPFCKRFFTVIILLLPILNQYLLPGNVEPIIVVAVVFSIIALKKSVSVTMDRFTVFFLITFCYSFFMLITNSFLISMKIEIFGIVFRYAKYFLEFIGIIYSSKKLFEYEYAIKIYQVISIVILCSVVIEYAFFILLGNPLYFIIPDVALSYNHGMNSNELIATLSRGVYNGYPYRPSAFFLEPSSVAYYILPWLALKIFNSKNKTILLIPTFALVLSSSTTGIVGIVLVWLFYFFRQGIVNHSVSKAKSILLVPIFGVITILIWLMVGKSDAVKFAIVSKLNSIRSFNISSSSSLNQRLLRGVLYFANMKWYNWLFGVGYGGLSEYYHAIHMNLIMDEGNQEVSYMNCMSTILNSFGVVGIILFWRWVIQIIKKSKDTFALSISFLIIICTSDCYHSPIYFLMIIMMLSAMRNSGNERVYS